jgi:beta-lactamase superfamily II metal-dependent hydrolase
MVTATLRMYAVGFGDCFLLTVPREGTRPWRMLVDCGVHGMGRGKHEMRAIVDDIVGTCRDDGGAARLNVVAATHRHQDHISGFANSRWAEVEVGEVWLPWSENPRDQVAQRLRTRLDALARTLSLQLAAFDADGAALALNSLSNEKAMTTLRTGFAGQPRRRYLSAEQPQRRELPGLPAAQAYVLGPSRTPEAIKAMDPPAIERWLSASAAGGESDGQPADSLFPEAYRIGDRAAYEEAFSHLTVSKTLLESIRTEPADGLTAASWLDRALNNTSLVFVFEVDDVRILFSGDAQWGSWRQILQSTDARTLLARTSLYKVSHHGSHNGTPKTLVNEVLPASLTSMVSVRSMSRWKAIPKTELVDALAVEGRTLLRADQAEEMPDAVRRGPDGLWTELDLD